MVETQITGRGIKQKEVVDAMLKVPRHLFTEETFISQAYNDYPLPIGGDQTISQPYIVALMTEALKLDGTEKVLEIGTGSGYQSAVLSLMAHKVYSVERLSTLADRARKILDSLLCSNVVIRVADGTLGWAVNGPYDAIIVTAGSPEVPEAYMQQLKVGGRLVIPVGGEQAQELIRVTRLEGAFKKESLGGCRFVKLVGKYGWRAKETGSATY